MAGLSDEFSANSPLSFDFTDALVDDDLAQKMRIPQKITVPGDGEEYASNSVRGNTAEAMVSSMAIPERIEIGNLASPTSDIPRDLRDNLVNVNSMSSMVTPPRTLTVDDTKSAYYPQRMTAGQPSTVRGYSGERASSAAKFMDDER